MTRKPHGKQKPTNKMLDSEEIDKQVRWEYIMYSPDIEEMYCNFNDFVDQMRLGQYSRARNTDK